jgi:hypothetical protein
MDVVGWVFIGFICAFVAVGLVFGLTSLPDARRYLKIRRM